MVFNALNNTDGWLRVYLSISGADKIKPNANPKSRITENTGVDSGEMYKGF